MPQIASATLFLGVLRQRRLWGIFLVILLLTVFVLSLAVGSTGSIFREALAGDPDARYILTELRLPRALAALMAGSLLGLAGAVMQTVLRNPLASPFTLGVSQGAAFGAAVAIVVFHAGMAHGTGSSGVTVNAPSLVVLCAFIGALTTVACIMVIGAVRDLSPTALILAGVALSAFFSAGTMFIQYAASDVQVAATVFWTFGDVGKAGWNDLAVMALVGIPVLALLLPLGGKLNALHWGDDTAFTLGVNARRLRLLCMVVAALAAAVATAYLGIIAFVGLMAPHLARLRIGDDQRHGLIFSTLYGAVILLAADIVARKIFAPIVLPVGIVTSFAGVPILLHLLLRRS